MKNIFTHFIIIICTVMLILMFFFPDYKAVKKLILNRLDVITLLLVIGLYIKDLLKS